VAEDEALTWGEIADEVHALESGGRRDVGVRGVQYDSRRVSAGDVFVAMRGGSTDGNQFVETALQSGAAAVVTDSRETFERLRERQPELAAALVEHGRRALAEVSAAVFGHPERALTLTAVTGTNGKTTTTFLLEQMLASVGRRSVLIGTIETHVAGEARAAEHTTPESRDVLALLAEGVRAGCTEAVMEMSSHALEQERVWGLPVDVAVFTNLTQDHLDFHGTMEAYARAKAKLFAGVGARGPRVAAINQDDGYAAEMVESFGGGELMRYGMGEYGTHRAENVRLALGDTRFDFVTPEATVAIRSPLSGRVNVYNLLAAMCAALARGMTLDEIAAATEGLQQVPGRFEVVRGSREAGFTVVVDYAHTDDALRNLIWLARESVEERGGRVITLFGCGGDRDRTKRPKMGLVAGSGSDLVVLTSDNPRGEDPMMILEEALAGLRETKARFVVEADRAVAIEMAVRAAEPGDIVLLAGKGHEKTQTFADRVVAFDDVAEAERILQELRAEVRA
jgi:UDP-N-acetylmuramoyl-L-alanyl-D-glutamate--2,6-diaminopimelate ligase